jgi:hypothetical protein
MPILSGSFEEKLQAAANGWELAFLTYASCNGSRKKSL